MVNYIEPNFTGHRMVYARHILRQYADAMLHTTEDALVSDEFAEHLGGSASHGLRARATMGNLHSIAEKRYFRWLLRQIRQIGRSHPGKLVIAEGDKLVPRLAFALRVPRATVLVLRAPEFSQRSVSALARDLLKLTSMVVCRMRGHDIVVLLPATRRASRYRWRSFRGVPDPVEIAATPIEIDEFRTRLASHGERKWLAIVGNIGARKNLPLLANAMATSDANGLGLVIAGVVQSDQLAMAEPALDEFVERGGALEIHDRLLSDSELDAIVGGVDAVAILHSTDGPSGILGKAAAMGTWVLAAGAPTLREDVQRLQCGMWSPLSLDAIEKTLREWLRSSVRRSDHQFASREDFALSLVEGR